MNLQDLLIALAGKVGPTQSADGSTQPLRLGKTGAMINSPGHGPYYEAVSRGRVFSAMNQTGVVLTVGLNGTYTGLVVSNPNGSGINASILAVGYQEVVAPTGIQTTFLAVGSGPADTVHSVPAVTYNMKVGGGDNTSICKADTGATLTVLPAVPRYVLPIQSGHTSGALSTAACLAMSEVGGMVCLTPGSYAFIAGFTIGVAVGAYCCIVWEEIPII
jgi:hypothetical protein